MNKYFFEDVVRTSFKHEHLIHTGICELLMLHRMKNPCKMQREIMHIKGMLEWSHIYITNHVKFI